MSKTKKSGSFEDIEDLNLPAFEEHIKGIPLPEVDEKTGKVTLKDIPDFDLEEKRTAQGNTTFFSLFAGSTGNQRDGYDETLNKSGKIFMNNQSGKFFISYLDLVALVGLVNEHIDFAKYQILRTRADIKEEIWRKSRFIE